MSTRNIYSKLREAFGDPIGSYAGDAPVGVRSVEEVDAVCPGCGMMAIDGQCGCGGSVGLTLCDCGMPPDRCECDGHVHEGVEPCAECGMYEVEGSCECTHMEEADLEEVTPPGKERMVKALKKDPDIDNPWAVAWAAHQKEKKKK